MQEALTTPATQTGGARTSTGSPTFPRRKGGTGGWSWGLVVRGAAKHLEDHPKVALRCEVRDPGAAELTAEDHVVLTLGPRNSLIEVRCGDGDVMYALTFLSKETGIDAFLGERLDKLPHHPADRGDDDARGALDRPTVLAVVIRLTGVDLSELPRADPIVVQQALRTVASRSRTTIPSCTVSLKTGSRIVPLPQVDEAILLELGTPTTGKLRRRVEKPAEEPKSGRCYKGG